MRPYQPRQIDIDWAKNMVRTLRNGGTMAFPATKLVYKIDHPGHRIILTNLDQLKYPTSRTCHEQTIETFKAIGYAVVEEQGEVKTENVGMDFFNMDGDDPRRG